MTINDFLTILPAVVLVCWATVLLVVDLWIPKNRKGITALLAASGMALAIIFCLTRGGTPAVSFHGSVVVDGFAVFLDVIFLVTGLGSIALAYDYLKRMNIERGEYYSLIMFATSGMILMTYANDLILIFLALEFLSIPLYVLAGFAQGQLPSEEAALKYFLMGTFSSGFVLYGVALIFGATAQTDLPGIAAAVTGGTANMVMFLVGAVLLLVGFCFKAGIVPFHMWAPDVYQGAPSPATAFMAVGAKAAGFAALMRVFTAVLPSLAEDITPVLWGLAALTMIFGNLLALAQTNLKRLLAFSSITQAGYMLMTFVPYGNSRVLNEAVAGMLFFLAGYCLSTLGAWAVVIAVEKMEGKGLELADYAGMGRKYPWLGAAMTVFMLSFIGVPPTLGFWGKFYLFRTAVDGGFTSLALIGLLTSLLSAYYYLRVVVYMYMRTGEPEARQDPWLNLTAVATAAAVVGISIFPGWLVDLAAKALIRLP